MSKQRRIKKGVKQKLKLEVDAGTHSSDEVAIASLNAAIKAGTVDDAALITYIIDPDQDNLATDDAGRKEAIKAGLTDGVAAGNILQSAGETEEAAGTSPVTADTDGGGDDDGTEVDAGTDPLDDNDD